MKKLRSIVFLFSLSLTMACGGSGGSGDPSPSPSPDEPTAIRSGGDSRQLNQILDQGEKRLQQVESGFGTMINRDVITTLDDDQLNEAMDDYSNQMQFGYGATRRDVDLAHTSSGRQGSALSADLFETTTKNHEMRLDRLNTQAQAIVERLRDGKAVLDRGMIERMSAEERLEFRDSLRPGGLRKVDKLYPDLFPKLSLGQRLKRGANKLVERGGRMCQAMPRSAEGVLVSTAEARIIFTCIGPCVAQNWSGCAACVGNSVPAAVQGVQDFIGCWKKKREFFWRVGCVFKLIGVLA